jgi:hypothetical protein
MELCWAVWRKCGIDEVEKEASLAARLEKLLTGRLGGKYLCTDGEGALEGRLLAQIKRKIKIGEGNNGNCQDGLAGGGYSGK